MKIKLFKNKFAKEKKNLNRRYLFNFILPRNNTSVYYDICYVKSYLFNSKILMIF